jgi:hypothetical protein
MPQRRRGIWGAGDVAVGVIVCIGSNAEASVYIKPNRAPLKSPNLFDALSLTGL